MAAASCCASSTSDYDPTNRTACCRDDPGAPEGGGIPNGAVVSMRPGQPEFHELNGTPDAALNAVPFEALCPGAAGMEKILARYR